MTGPLTAEEKHAAVIREASHLRQQNQALEARVQSLLSLLGDWRCRNAVQALVEDPREPERYRANYQAWLDESEKALAVWEQAKGA